MLQVNTCYGMLVPITQQPAPCLQGSASVWKFWTGQNYSGLHTQKLPEWTDILIEMFLIVLILITIITVDFVCNFNL